MKHVRAAIVLVLLVVGLVAPAARAASAEGHWDGAIDLPTGKLAFDVDFATKDGSLTGDISIPAQGARDLPLAGVAANGDALTFAIPGIPGEPTFQGKFAPDGVSVAGTFSQSGQSFPFTMTRGTAPAAAAAGALEGFDADVDRAIAGWETPGVAIAIVREGSVVYARGFGERDVARSLPVTTRTLFAIGSTTKAFTTFVMGTLVDEGKLDWDRPVKDYIPFFALQDPVASDHITPRDLVTHRSGLPRHDALWYNNATMSRKELVAHLAHLAPSAELREKFQYNNVMFLTAGQVVATITGGSWEDAVRTRVFEPIGMTDSNFSVLDSQKTEDFAKPHDRRDDKVVEIPFRNITTISAAGSINSNVQDLARWMIVHLNGGKVDGKAVISPATLDELHRPQMVTGTAPDRPEISSPSYALGWFVDTYRGHLRVSHGGAIDGFGAFVCLMPNDGVGVVVLQNIGYNGLPSALAQQAVDRVLGLPPIDWSGDALKKVEAARKLGKEAQGKKAMFRKTGTQPSHALEEYAGVYQNDGYGPATVTLKAGALTFEYNGIVAPLEHWHYDVFNAGKNPSDPTLEDMKLNFRSDVKGNVAEVEVPLEPAVDPIVFKKRPDAKLSDPSYLARFLGSYDLGPVKVTVGLKGDGLTLSVPGQPVYDLVPDLGDEFNLKGVNGFSTRFETDASGKVTTMIVIQPDGVYTAKRVD